MNGPYYLETLARNGDVLQRHRVAALPIRVGRGYDNDVILDDPYAAPNHALIEAGEDGALAMRDLGSRNGIVHRGRRVDKVALDGDTVVRMGHTSLRVRRFDFAVQPEAVDRTMHRWEGALPGLTGLLLVALVGLFGTWLTDFEPFQPVRYLQMLAGVIAGALVWGGAWAIGNRLFGMHPRLGRHLFILGCALLAITLIEQATAMAAYAFSLDALVRYASHFTIATVCAMIYFHLATVRPHRSRRFAVFCAAMFVIGSGLVLLGNQQRSGRLADREYMSQLQPPSLRASRDRSVDEFMRAAAALKPRLDLERTKKVSDQEGEEENEEE